MLLSDGTHSVDWDLDTDKFNVTKLGLYGDGANNTTNVVWSNLSLTATNVNIPAPTPAVPEPATATLSLLALAGLASRRRRK